MAISLNSSGITFPDGLTQTANTWNSNKGTGVDWPVALLNCQTGWGYRNPMVITSDGGIRAWGYSAAPGWILGQYTDGDCYLPVNIPFPKEFPGAVSVVHTSFNAMCIDREGNIWSWGYNNRGQNGLGTTSFTRVPTKVTGGSISGKTVTEIHGTYRNSSQSTEDSFYAICSDGTMHAVGYNGYGQLGDSSTTDRSLFVRCGTLTNVTYMSGSRDYETTVHAVAGGALYGWGFGGNNNIGNNSTSNRNTPTLVNTGAISGKTVTKVYHMGAESTFALCSDGALTAWGVGGKTGNGNGTNLGEPNNTNTSVAGCYAACYAHHRAIIWKTDGTVWITADVSSAAQYTGISYTYNQYNQVTGTNYSYSSPAQGWVQITTGKTTSIKKCITAGTSTATFYILYDDGALYAVGYSGNGQAGTLGQLSQLYGTAGYIRNGTASTDPSQMIGGISQYTGTANEFNNMRVYCDAVEDIACTGEGSEYGFYVLTKKGQVKYSGSGSSKQSAHRDGDQVLTPQPIQFN